MSRDRAFYEKLASEHGDEYALSVAISDAVNLSALLNTPELEDFSKAVVLESAHQRQRWGEKHDAGKTDADWFWLIGYLGGKALHNPPTLDGRSALELKLHRIITIGAAASNWHARVRAKGA